MKARLLFLVLVALTFTLPGAATAQQLFDFYGMTLLPSAEGESLTMYSVVRDASPIETPIPLDFANFEYTIVVTDLVLVTDANPQVYANGVIALYEDDVTTADFADAASFIDGQALLTGVITSLDRWVFTSTLGNASGNVNWTGGANINDIAPEDQMGWAFLSATNNRVDSVEPGYDEVWDGKVEPEEPIVETDKVSWDELKAMF